MTDNPFETTFTYRTAIDYEPGVTRRDPSPVIRVGSTYYVWYSKATVDFTGYYASVYGASSPDGLTWTETGEAVPKGGPGAWDENGVFTPTTLVWGGRYWLYYTAVPKPFTNDNGGPGATPTAIGAAVADKPEGPWTKVEQNPLLRPGTGTDFDSHRLDDACIIVREGKIRLYYKGRQHPLSPKETKMGLAVAECPTGPFVKHPGNPLIDSGHEVCVVPYGPGVMALVSGVGPQGHTVQYAEDGLHFSVKAKLVPPSAPGPFREDNYREGDGPGMTWGICHAPRLKDRPFLLRFDCDL